MFLFFYNKWDNPSHCLSYFFKMVKTNQSDVSLSSPQFKFTSDGLREALRQALDQLGAPFFYAAGMGY